MIILRALDTLAIANLNNFHKLAKNHLMMINKEELKKKKGMIEMKNW